MQQLFTFLVLLLVTKINGDPDDFRPPAVPLIVFSPHISIWSFSDKLTDSNPVHWSGSSLSFHSLIDIDNEIYRFLGVDPPSIPPLIQKKLIVEPWRTIYIFKTSTNTIELILKFSQTTSIDDPFTYITFDLRSLDQQIHNIKIYFEESSMLSLNDYNDKLYWSQIDGDLIMNNYNQIPFNMMMLQ